jgi:NAD(P)-dependent dehydrogenase (short-subunit alcohol dehydrogenase family)
VVCPGYIDTPLLQPLWEISENQERIIAHHPIGRLGKPEEIAQTVVWLSSDAASFITGASISADGGYVAQ